MADEEEGEVDQIPRLDFAAWRKKREEAKAKGDPFPKDLFPEIQDLSAHCTLKLDLDVSVRPRRV